VPLSSWAHDARQPAAKALTREGERVATLIKRKHAWFAFGKAGDDDLSLRAGEN
jgi:hypothetical protein